MNESFGLDVVEPMKARLNRLKSLKFPPEPAATAAMKLEAMKVSILQVRLE
jgi:hypothetical protein